jgi:hypothetical protein
MSTLFFFIYVYASLVLIGSALTIDIARWVLKSKRALHLMGYGELSRELLALSRADNNAYLLAFKENILNWPRSIYTWCLIFTIKSRCFVRFKIVKFIRKQDLKQRKLRKKTT